MTLREQLRVLLPGWLPSADHRGGIRRAITSRGELWFVMCRCGWRSRLQRSELDAWSEHDRHVFYAVDDGR
jgi:hypothetical protein